MIDAMPMIMQCHCTLELVTGTLVPALFAFHAWPQVTQEDGEEIASFQHCWADPWTWCVSGLHQRARCAHGHGFVRIYDPEAASAIAPLL